MKRIGRVLVFAGSWLGSIPATPLWAVVPPEAAIDDRTAVLALAETLSWREGTRGEAVALYRDWLARNPDDREAERALVMIEVATGEAAAAAARLEAWAAREDLPPAGRLLLGEAFLQLERWNEAAALADALLNGTGDGDMPA